MKLRLTMACACLALLFALGAAPVQAEFDMKDFDVTFTNPDGSTQAQAGSHPFTMTTDFEFTTEDVNGLQLPTASAKDIEVAQLSGFVGDQTAVPRCATADFLTFVSAFAEAVPNCSDSSAVGSIEVLLGQGGGGGLGWARAPLYNLEPAPGKAAKLGFVVVQLPITIDIGLSESPPYNIVASSRNTTQIFELGGVEFTLWGVPGDPAHDSQRGGCYFSGGKASCSGGTAAPFLTLPRACRGPLATNYEMDTWENPGTYLPGGAPDLSDPNWITGSALTHDEAGNQAGLIGCGKLPFSPSITAQPTSKAATSPTGLDFSLDVSDEGLINPNEGATAGADIEKAVVTLPEGMSANPSLADGLVVCSEAQLEAETVKSEPGEGCPNASKIGSVTVESPLVEEPVNGALFIAKPYENPFDSLLAMYIVIKNKHLGIIVKQPLKIVPDPVTGQLTTVAEDLPQLPFSHFRLHFREGARSPLSTPQACGTYKAETTLYPSSGGAPVPTTSAFQIISGPDGGACPKGGLPPFHPDLLAGTLNNAAGRFSPFNVKITRTDSEQEITHFSIKLPPGVAGKLAGVPFCSDAQIARATARTGPHGGAEELADPSCSAPSQVGRTLAGAGVGPSLAYAPGKVYLAGPYHGAPISFVSITSGVVGPFDIGTVVVRLAIRVNPETGEVFLDAVGSDPIPHIVLGIPVHLRDIRAYTDRPNFTFNPTSCARKSTAATVLGSGLDFASEADDNPFVSTSPFQAADCAALPFKPKLSLKLVGGTKRGAHPALKAFLRMNGFGEAGVAKARVTLPRSEFIENAHFNTICTRAQFKLQGGNGEACPAGSIYGWARAKSPVLSDPVEGPIFLRSSEHQLPDVVAALRGSEINVHLVGHVDSVKGQLRNTFETVPDAPVEWASFSFQGAKKGLFVNSTDLCKKAYKAKVEFDGQNGKSYDYGAPLKVKCKGGAKKQKKAKGHKRAAR